MARHPSTEGNDLSPRRVDAQKDVTVPGPNGARLSFADAVEGIASNVDFEDVEGRDFELVEGRDYDLLENKPNRVTESGSVSVASNFTFVEFEITFSTSFSEITSIHTGIDGSVSSFNDTRSAYETTLVEFDENGMTVNAMPCQENSGNLRWTVWGIES